MDPLAMYLGGFIILIIVVSAGASWMTDKLNWNNGYCRKSGRAWTFSRTEMNGDRFYITTSGDTCTISWDVDK